MGTIRHATLTSELAGNKVGADEWDAAHDIDLAISDITGLQASLDAKADETDLSGYATTSDLTAGLAGKLGYYDASGDWGAGWVGIDTAANGVIVGTYLEGTANLYGGATPGFAFDLPDFDGGAYLDTSGGFATFGIYGSLSGFRFDGPGQFTGALTAPTAAPGTNTTQVATTAFVAAGYQPLATVLTNTTASFTTAQETKLAGIASGATANSSDATLLARANHTGTQSYTTITGLGSLANASTINGGNWSGQDLAVADGGTGASTASAARTNLGVVIGTDVKAQAPSVQSVTSSATVTPTFSDDGVKITAQAAGLTLANPSGTAVPMWGWAIRIKDNGTARSISYGTQYRAIGVTLPTTTVISKTLYLGCIWNDTDTKVDVVAVAQEA